MSRNADRNLLWGILALQVEFITRDALIDGMNDWAKAKHRNLEDILVERGDLSDGRREALAPLVAFHIAEHGGDAANSLAALTSIGSAREAIEAVADPDVQASLGHVATNEHDTVYFPTAPADSTASVRFHRLRPHAKGNLGEVFVARDNELNREVALKEIQERHSDREDFRQRFLVEAEITGRLEHPGIVPVYGLGRYPDGRPFYAMRFIKGESLAEAIASFHEVDRSKSDPGERSLELRDLLRRFTDVCNAVAYAHARGILHRDLKPGNIMVGKYGETLVVDWGLAKVSGDRAPDVSESALLPSSGSGLCGTAAGSVIGTPAYMPPEQAEGRLERLGPRSDVYSLGATLYHLLTGRPPFEHGDLAEVLRRVVRGDFPPPRAITPSVPRGLEAICLKAMATRTEDRYPSALALVADVDHWLADEPVSAWREPLTTQLARLARRHRSALVGTAGVLVTFVVGLAIALYFWSKARVATLEREIAYHLNDREWTDDRLPTLELRLAELRGLDPQVAKSVGDRVNQQFAKSVKAQITHPEPLKPEGEARIQRMLDRLAARDPALVGPLRENFQERLSRLQRVFVLDGPSADWAAVLDPARVLVAGGRLLPKTPAGATADRLIPTRVPWRGDVQLEATFSAAWEKAHEVGLELLSKPGHTRPIRALAVSPDGRLLASSSEDLTIKLWDVVEGRVLDTFGPFPDEVEALAFSPDGQTLASSLPGVGLRLWDVAGRKERLLTPAVSAPGSQVRSLAYSPVGKALAAGVSNGTVLVWEPDTGRQLATLQGPRDATTCLAYSPDGTLLAAGSWSGPTTLWDVAARRERFVLAGPKEGVKCLAFSPDGTLLATGHRGSNLKIWEVASGTLRTSAKDESLTHSIAWGRDGKTVITVSHNGFQIWNPDNWKRDERRTDLLAVRGVGAFSPVTGIFFVGGPEGSIRRWEVDGLRERATLQREGYQFLVTAPRPPASEDNALPAPRSMGSIREAGGKFQLEIRRNGVSLRQMSAKVEEIPAGPLQLRAAREGNRLTLQVGKLRPMVFRDAFPLDGGDRGVYALLWPDGVGLERFWAAAPRLRAIWYPLERGDDYYAQRKFEEAVADYEAQIITSGSSEVGHQARYKKAIALLELGRDDQAIGDLMKVASDPEVGDPWRPLAMCRLWLIHLRKGEYGEAEKWFERLSATYPQQDESQLAKLVPTDPQQYESQLAMLVPADLRAQIINDYIMRSRSVSLYVHDPNRIRYARRAVDICETFPELWRIASAYRFILIRAYRAAGQEAEALRVSRKILDECDSNRFPPGLTSLIEHFWLVRSVEGPEAALRELDGRLFERPGGPYRKEAHLLLLERARLLEGLGRRDEAEHDIEELFGLLTPEEMGDQLPAACLVRGFLRAERVDGPGAEAGAQVDWRQGLLPPGRVDPIRGFEWAHNAILGGLTDTLTDDKAAALQASILEAAGPDSFVSIAVRLAHPSLLRTAWQTPLGRDYARKFAFRADPFAENIRIPFVASGVEYFRLNTFSGATSPEQDAVIQESVERLIAAVVDGQINSIQLSLIGSAWKTGTPPFPWVARGLKPEIRGPLAYLFGHHQLQQGNPGQAKRCFLDAREYGKPDSTLGRQIRIELDLLAGPASGRP